MEKEERKKFVATTNPKETPWLTNVYIGERDGTGNHTHLTVSGSGVWYYRDEEGNEIIKNGSY